MVPTLETRRLILRPVAPSDVSRYQSLFADFKVIEFLDGNVIPWPYPENGVQEFLSFIQPKIDAGETYLWALALKESPSEMIGVLHLNPWSEIDNRGFWLGVEYWRQGYMTEAVQVTTDYAFDVLGVKLLRLTNAEPNTGSRRIKEKAGAKFVGYSEPKYFAGGGTYRSAQWELTPEDWKLNRYKFA